MRFSMLCLSLSGLLWGTSGLLGSLLGQVAGFSPLMVASARLLIGGALMMAYLAAAGTRLPGSRAAWRRVAVNGVLSAIFQGCYFAAISLTSVSLATLVTIGAAPVIVAAAERIRGGLPLGRRGLVTQGLALAGLVLLVGGPGGAGSGSGAAHALGSGHVPVGGQVPGAEAGLAGCGLALLSAAAFAAITVIGTSPVPGLSDLTVNGYGFVLGGLVLLPFAAAGGGGPGLLGLRAGMSAPELLAAAGLLLGLAVGPTAVGYTLYYRGLRGESASTAALLTLLEPLAAAVLGAVFLGDRLGLAGLIGAVILGAALIRAALQPVAAPAASDSTVVSGSGKAERAREASPPGQIPT